MYIYCTCTFTMYMYMYMHTIGFSATNENTQNLYPNFDFTIVILFTVVQVCIKYHNS